MAVVVEEIRHARALGVYRAISPVGRSLGGEWKLYVTCISRGQNGRRDALPMRASRFLKNGLSGGLRLQRVQSLVFGGQTVLADFADAARCLGLTNIGPGRNGRGGTLPMRSSGLERTFFLAEGILSWRQVE